MKKFIFDLDGTITINETLPMIGKEFNIDSDIEKITIDTVCGNLSFEEGFTKRVMLLKEIPVSKVQDFLKDTQLFPRVVDFIQRNKNDCVIATGNLDCWTKGLTERIGCTTFCSEAIVENDKLVGIKSLLNKEKVVKKYQSQGNEVIFVGDGYNDVVAMRFADFSIAVGITHTLNKSIIEASSQVVNTEDELREALEAILIS